MPTPFNYSGLIPPKDGEPDCYAFYLVNATMAGQEVCVYGNVLKTQTVGQNRFQVLFSSNPKAFFLEADSYYYKLHSGDCVAAKGKILTRNGVAYIDIDEALYECEYWMYR